MKEIYFDHSATTPVDPSVFETMLPYLRDRYGNPSSSYRLGKEARQAMENAREQVAALIGASPDEIIFTSGVPKRITSPYWGRPTGIGERQAYNNQRH